MSITQFQTVLETFGFPILVSAVAAYALWFVLKWVLVKLSRDIEQQIRDMAAEIDEEQIQSRAQVTEVKTILIRLVDRVRLLGEELNSHDQVARTIWGLDPKKERGRTQSEIRDDLLERLRHVPEKNGD